MRTRRPLVYIALVPAVFSSMLFSLLPEAAAQIFLAPSEKRVEALEKFKFTDNKKLLEARKIQYLITLVAQSPFTFIRNGQPYTSREAASHLRFKYGKSGGRIETARQFIEYCASKSILTGQSYLIRTGEGTTFPVKDLLEHELAFLEKSVVQN